MHARARAPEITSNLNEGKNPPDCVFLRVGINPARALAISALKCPLIRDDFPLSSARRAFLFAALAAVMIFFLL